MLTAVEAAGSGHPGTAMSLAPLASNSYLEGEHDMAMLESFLTFLATLMSVRTNLGKFRPSLTLLSVLTPLFVCTDTVLVFSRPKRRRPDPARDGDSPLYG